MIPEPSALNWSSEKPTYDEVKGKKIVLEWAHFGGKSISSYIVDNRNVYNGIFDGLFIRYAIIADQPEPEPLNICGVPVLIVQNMPDAHYQWGFMSHKDAVRAAEIIDLAIGHILEELGR